MLWKNFHHVVIKGGTRDPIVMGHQALFLSLSIILSALFPVTTVSAAETGISTIAQLKNALAGSGGNYILTGDIAGISTSIKVTKGIHVLDLNGHAISGKILPSPIIWVNGGSLTVNDGAGGRSMTSNGGSFTGENGRDPDEAVMKWPGLRTIGYGTGCRS